MLLAVLRCFGIVAPAAWEWSMYDFAVRNLVPSPPSNENVVIVQISVQSLEEMETAWPLPRTAVAEFISKLSDAQPAAIAMDMLFQKPTQQRFLVQLEHIRQAALDQGAIEGSPLIQEVDRLLDRMDDDNQLAQAIANSGKAILGNIILHSAEAPVFRGRGHPQIDSNLHKVELSALGVGILNANRDWDGVVRRYSYLWHLDGQTYPSLALAALQNAYPERADEFERRAADLDDGSPLLRFPRKRITRAHFSDILMSDDPAHLRKLLQGRVVFVGVTAAGQHDQHATPVSNVLPGVEVHAFGAMNLLNDTHYLSGGTAAWVNLVLTLLFLAGVFLATERLAMTWLLSLALVISGVHLLVMYIVLVTLGWLLAFVPLAGGAVALVGLEVLYRVRALRKSRRDVEQQERLNNAKSDFMATISHELRTPLTSIRGSLGLIAGGAVGKLEPQMGELIRIAHSNTERLIRLVNNFLDFQKMATGKMEYHFKVMELGPLLRDIVAANHGYGEQFNVGIELIDKYPVWVSADSDLMTQAVTNLISNAIKFSPKGDAVQITTEEVDTGIRIAVRDRGPGISEEFQRRIFTRFAQAADANSTGSKGSGLGLSIVKIIVEEHSGQVGFETEIGAGTTFYIDLPHCEPPGDDSAGTGDSS